jgi:hypothetical protein
LPTFLGMPIVDLPAAAAYIAPCCALDLIGILALALNLTTFFHRNITCC